MEKNPVETPNDRYKQGIRISAYLVAFALMTILMLQFYILGQTKISEWVLGFLGLALTTLLGKAIELFMDEFVKRQITTQKLYKDIVNEYPHFYQKFDEINLKIKAIQESQEEMKKAFQALKGLSLRTNAAVESTSPDSLINAFRFLQTQLDEIRHYIIVFPDRTYKRWEQMGKTIDYVLDMISGRNEEFPIKPIRQLRTDIIERIENNEFESFVSDEDITDQFTT